MIRRAALVALTTAALLPLAAGTAHASCLDDATASSPFEGYSQAPKSPYWTVFYVQVTGTATVAVYGDAAVSDWSSWANDDLPEFIEVGTTNVTGTATGFVDCVAG